MSVDIVVAIISSTTIGRSSWAIVKVVVVEPMVPTTPLLRKNNLTAHLDISLLQGRDHRLRSSKIHKRAVLLLRHVEMFDPSKLGERFPELFFRDPVIDVLDEDRVVLGSPISLSLNISSLVLVLSLSVSMSMVGSLTLTVVDVRCRSGGRGLRLDRCRNDSGGC